MVTWGKSEYESLVQSADDYAEQERKNRLSRSQPLRINWLPVLGIVLLLTALAMAFGAGLWVRTWFQ
jgi:hypothetical protein